MLKPLIILISLNLSSFAIAEERSDAFLVKVFDSYVRVVSPDKNYSLVSIIIENKTMSKLIGKVVKGKTDLAYLAIDPDKTKSVQVKYSKEEKLIFIPMAPASQEVELIVGKKTYEIPPQK